MYLGWSWKKLKISRVVLVYKKKRKKMDVKNYRFTAISSVKLQNQWKCNSIETSNANANPISNTQHVFRPRRSVQTNLMNSSIAAHDNLFYCIFGLEIDSN